MADDLSAYIPIDRRHALARGAALPDHATGAALFADVAGFTTLAEALVHELGPRRGAEDLTAQLNGVYESLIGAVHAYGGSVVGFSGDAITCWFDDQLQIADCRLQIDDPNLQSAIYNLQSPAALRAVACALAMQRAMRQLTIITTPAGALVALAIKAAVVAGPVRRFLVGDPAIQLLDVLAGATLDRLAATEHLAERGEVVLDAETAAALGAAIVAAGWRVDAQTGHRVAVVASLARPVARSPWPALPPDRLTEAQIQPWLAPAGSVRLDSGPDRFLAELRPAVALMLQFDGIDYDQDARAGAWLDAYIREVQQVVARYEGRLLDVTIGDKGSYLYIVFGAPIAHDDDAARAVAAALDLRSTTPGARIGIAAGQMRCGAYGGAHRRTYGVLGDKTNLAARLMGQAEAGTILADDTTYRQARRRWDFAVLPPVRVKGKAGLIALYRPTGRRARRVAAPTGITTLIGRQAEVADLHECLDAVEAGESRIVILEGEAGIGKSRLVAELGELLRERGVVGLVGSAHSPKQTIYRAWRSIFAAYFGLETAGAEAGPPTTDAGAAPLSDPLERWSRVRMHALSLVPDLVERLPLLNDVLNLGLPDSEHTRALDIERRGERLGELLIELLRAWAAEQPLVLVIEDAHYLDIRACELAVRVARSFTAAGLPLLLVIALQPLDAEHPTLAHVTTLLSLPGARLIRLPPLGPEATTMLVAARLGIGPTDLPAEVADLVRARADGNPLFAEELVAALRDQGLIRVEPAEASSQPERAHCVIVGDLQRAGQALPDNLQGLLLARIDRLLPAERLTLKVAAVLGRSFEYQPLHYARARQAAIDALTLKNQLRDLAARGFTWLESPEPNLTYRFRNILTQEAAYQTLLYAQRRELHRAVAEWYERTFGSSEFSVLSAEFARSAAQNSALKTQHSALAPYVALLAYHYRQAEDREREGWYVTQLGEQAFNMSAFSEAIACFERGLALAPRDDLTMQARRAWLTARLARAHLYTGDRDAARQLYHESLALAEAAGDQAGAADASYELGALAEHRGEHAKALDYLQRGLALYRAAQDLAGEGRTLDRLGGLYIELGDEARALECYQQAIALGRRARKT